jgi:mono/diheme cytochrome c family protein
MPASDQLRARRVPPRVLGLGLAGVLVAALVAAWIIGSASSGDTTAEATGPGVAFTKRQSCGVCHALKALHWTGDIGRDLDRVRPAYRLTVESITNGDAPMPSFDGTLTSRQIRCVATVVATLSAGGGAPRPATEVC